MERPGGRAFDRAQHRGAQGFGAAHGLRRDRGLCQGPGRAAEDRGQGPQGSGELPLDRQGRGAGRGAPQGHRPGTIRNGRAGARHGLRRGAAIALSGRRAADRGRCRGPQGGGHHRCGPAAGWRRRHRRHGRGDAGRQEPAQGHLVGCAGRSSRQRARARGVRGHRARQEPRRGGLHEGRRCQGCAGGRRQGVSRRISHALRLSRPDGADECDRLGQSRRQIGRGLDRHPGGEQPVERGCPPAADRPLEAHPAPARDGGRLRPSRAPRDRARCGPPRQGGRQAGQADLESRGRCHLRQVPSHDGAPYRGRPRCQRQGDRLAPPRGRRIRSSPTPPAIRPRGRTAS